MKIFQKLKGLLGADSEQQDRDIAHGRVVTSNDQGSSSAGGDRQRPRGESSGGSRRGRGRGRRRRGSGGSYQERSSQQQQQQQGQKQERGAAATGAEKQQSQPSEQSHSRHSGQPGSEGSQGPGRSRRRGRGGRRRGGGSQGEQPSGQGSREETSSQARPQSQQRQAGGPGGRSRSRGGKKRSRGRTSRSELGGVAQRVEFPELLEVEKDSEQFTGNEFRPLGLNEEIVMALARNRFRTPTDIQREVIPVGLEGRDILGQAKTGTGKTVAFLMPIFQRLDQNLNSVQALIVVPTRELCRQVSWEARRFGRSFEFKVMSVYGGTAVKSEIEELKRQPGQIIVGTPGRLLDHISNKNLNLSRLNTLVLDEADRMFDIGFRDDIIKIIKACPEKRQIMLLSATMDDNVEYLARRFMHDPVKLYVSKDEITVESIWQRIISVERGKKISTLISLLRQQNPTQSIIFSNTKRMSDTVALQLEKRGFKARCIHSDLSQNKRERIMDDFRTGKIEHLVATDVAARGLDITGISHVINYDIPDNPEDYVHRVGRTGRMGAAGKAFTFVSSSEGEQLTKVEMFIDKMIDEWDVDGGEGQEAKSENRSQESE